MEPYPRAAHLQLREPEERVPGAKIATLEKMKEMDGNMGGIGSGRMGGKPTVGGGLSLHLYDLLRNGDLWLRWSTADPSTVQKQEARASGSSCAHRPSAEDDGGSPGLE